MALTVESILSCVAIVGILSQTWKRLWNQDEEGIESKHCIIKCNQTAAIVAINPLASVCKHPLLNKHQVRTNAATPKINDSKITTANVIVNNCTVIPFVSNHPHPLVRALPGQLLGDPCDLLGGIGYGLGASDELPLAPGVLAHELGQLGHEEGGALGRRHNVVVLGRPLSHLLVEVVRGLLETERGDTFRDFFSVIWLMLFLTTL